MRFTEAGIRIGESGLATRGWDVEFGVAGVDEHGRVGADGKVDADVVVGHGDGDGAGVVDEVAPEPVGVGLLVAG